MSGIAISAADASVASEGFGTLYSCCQYRNSGWCQTATHPQATIRQEST